MKQYKPMQRQIKAWYYNHAWNVPAEILKAEIMNNFRMEEMKRCIRLLWEVYIIFHALESSGLWVLYGGNSKRTNHVNFDDDGDVDHIFLAPKALCLPTRR